ncbi:hypothetical protein [Edaphobacter aggregans]|uniref:hypothetical protein n=1 Tax=Edaphobacter aggregans TaxID=570835 RepID=UPI00068A2049|nr:hypothetical protein [Edaphobacter aggregans]
MPCRASSLSFRSLTGRGQLNNYFRNAGLSDNNDSYDGRVDWTASKTDNLFVRYSYISRSRFIPGNYGGIADGTSTSAFGRQKIYSHSAVLGWTHILSPNILNEFHLGFIRNRSIAQQDPFGLNAADEFVPGIPNNPAVAGGVPLTQFANFTFIGSPDFLPKSQTPQQIQWVDTVSLALGKHSLKLGGTLYAPMRNIFQDEPALAAILASPASSVAGAAVRAITALRPASLTRTDCSASHSRRS